MSALGEQARIEFLILANHVEVANGLLYISGGGWTDHFRPPQSSQQVFVSHLGVGLSLYIPWNDTHHEHRLHVRLEDESDGFLIAHAESQVTVGRPSALPKGEPQHVVVGMTIDTTFPQPGSYHVFATLNGEDSNAIRWAFRVHDLQAGNTPPTQ